MVRTLNDIGVKSAVYLLSHVLKSDLFDLLEPDYPTPWGIGQGLDIIKNI